MSLSIPCPEGDFFGLKLRFQETIASQYRITEGDLSEIRSMYLSLVDSCFYTV
jgi:hypothetical protein